MGDTETWNYQRYRFYLPTLRLFKVFFVYTILITMYINLYRHRIRCSMSLSLIVCFPLIYFPNSTRLNYYIFYLNLFILDITAQTQIFPNIIYKLQKFQTWRMIALPQRLPQINVLLPNRNVELLNVCVKTPTIKLEPLAQSVRLEIYCFV